MDATNNVAERVMRILVMIRKNWGGNRTWKGARTQAVLTSILCTARQQDRDAFALLVDLLRSAEPKLLDLLPEGNRDDSAWEPVSHGSTGDQKNIRSISAHSIPAIRG